MKKLFLSLFTFLLMGVSIFAAPTVSLAWDPSPDSDVTNYRLYWGPGSGNYNGSSDLGNVTNTIFTQLVPGGHYWFVVTAINAGGAESDPSNEIDFLVPNTNTSPVISDIANQNVVVGTAIAPLVFTVGDAETLSGNLTLVANSSNPMLIPVTNIVFSSIGTNRIVTVVPVIGQVGTSTITITVSDGQGGTTNDSFIVTVIAIPNSPINFRIIQSLQTAETPTGPWNNIETNIVFRTSTNNAEFYRVMLLVERQP